MKLTNPVFAKNSTHSTRTDVTYEGTRGWNTDVLAHNITALHQAYISTHSDAQMLEVSSKSNTALGAALSAFNLTMTDSRGISTTVECAFQAGKIFENGGPFLDLLHTSSLNAKKDARLKTSGRIIGFTYDGQIFPNKPTTLFYNYLYLTALSQHPELTEQLVQYNAFTDIAFNPARAKNCQADACATYVSLVDAGLFDQAMMSPASFANTVYSVDDASAHHETTLHLPDTHNIENKSNIQLER